MRHSRKTIFVALFAALSLLAAACGDDDDAGTDDAATEADADDTGADDAGSDDADAADDAGSDDADAADDADDAGADDADDADAADETDAGGDGVAAAQARVDAFRQPIADLAALGITEPVAVPADLDVFYAQCPVPVCEVIGQGMQAAVDAMGGNLTIQAYDGTPEGTQAAWQAGVQAEPDMFLSSGNPVEWYEAELAQFNEAGVPVIQWSVPDGFQPEGMAGNLITGGDYYFQGALIADYITAATGGDANVLLINIPGTFPVLDLEQQGFLTEFEAVCPDCSVNVQEITVPQLLAGEHIGIAISECQKDEAINYIFAGFGDLLIGLHEALGDSGVCDGVPSISQAGTPANYALIEAGLQAADVGLPTEFLAYRALDVGLRALAGQEVGTAPARDGADLPAAASVDGASDILVAGLPMQLLEQDSVGDPTTAWPGVEGFQDQFLALWEAAS